MNPFLLAIMGPTASGKSALAEKLASHFGAQLINADAFQVYRGLDIGTAKPKNRKAYKLLDLIGPEESFGLGEYLHHVHGELRQLYKDGKPAIVVGGTGLYIRALFERYDDMFEAPPPELRQRLMEREVQEGLDSLVKELLERSPSSEGKVDLNNPIRVRRALEKLDSKPMVRYELPPFKTLKVGVISDHEDLKPRIRDRLDEMIAEGWKNEVQCLIDSGVPTNAPGFKAIGYREWISLLNGLITETEVRQQIFEQTCQYAKRQRTWLRREPNLRKLEESDTGVAFQIVTEWVTKVE